MKITLCGSTKFKNTFEEWNKKLTLAGHIVYTVSCFGHADKIEYTEEQKNKLDLVHFIKILNSDAIFVLDVDDYIGFSTKREIVWAELNNKLVYYLSAGADGEYLTRDVHYD